MLKSVQTFNRHNGFWTALTPSTGTGSPRSSPEVSSPGSSIRAEGPRPGAVGRPGQGCRAHALISGNRSRHPQVTDPPDEGTLLGVWTLSVRSCRCIPVPNPARSPSGVVLGGYYSEHVPETRFIETASREWDCSVRRWLRLICPFYAFVYYGVHQTANMVWPDDRSWCLATGDRPEHQLHRRRRGADPGSCLSRNTWRSGRQRRRKTSPLARIPSIPPPRRRRHLRVGLASILRRLRFINLSRLMNAARGWRQRRDGDSTLPTAHLYVAKSGWRKRD